MLEFLIVQYIVNRLRLFARRRVQLMSSSYKMKPCGVFVKAGEWRGNNGKNGFE